MKDPILVEIFLDGDKRDDLRIQFKYESLTNFCYIFGLLDHVIGRCNFRTPARVTYSNGISSKLFGSWLRAEKNGSLLFINLFEAIMADEQRLLEDLKLGSRNIHFGENGNLRMGK